MTDPSVALTLRRCIFCFFDLTTRIDSHNRKKTAEKYSDIKINLQISRNSAVNTRLTENPLWPRTAQITPGAVLL